MRAGAASFAAQGVLPPAFPMRTAKMRPFTEKLFRGSGAPIRSARCIPQWFRRPPRGRRPSFSSFSRGFRARRLRGTPSGARRAFCRRGQRGEREQRLRGRNFDGFHGGFGVVERENALGENPDVGAGALGAGERHLHSARGVGAQSGARRGAREKPVEQAYFRASAIFKTVFPAPRRRFPNSARATLCRRFPFRRIPESAQAAARTPWRRRAHSAICAAEAGRIFRRLRRAFLAARRRGRSRRALPRRFRKEGAREGTGVEPRRPFERAPSARKVRHHAGRGQGGAQEGVLHRGVVRHKYAARAHPAKQRQVVRKRRALFGYIVGDSEEFGVAAGYFALGRAYARMRGDDFAVRELRNPVFDYPDFRRPFEVYREYGNVFILPILRESPTLRPCKRNLSRFLSTSWRT